jgi:hypothetical protein
MKILALEKDVPGITGEAFTEKILKEEALVAWKLYQAGKIRELYFRQDKHAAVLILEAQSLDEARATTEQLPLVRDRLIDFELIPLAAYPGFARLFAAT